MDCIRLILQILCGLCAAWLLIMLVYQLYLTVFGFRKATKDYADHDPESRFLILVPAHNEEQVIGDIIDNLNRMDYPRELYDFYIIADNCTDDTARVAREAGAQVIETWRDGPDAPTGKPIALKKALNLLGDYQQKYDLLMIFDADNLMDTNMFREVNSQYLDKGKPDLIQCYLGAKNKQGAIAWFYYSSYTVTNRFFQLAKHRLGVNCSVGGTGYAISTAYVAHRGGWTSMSLTEDIEIQMQATGEGRHILWNHVSRVYDEKPTSLRASLRQKIRWSQGHWYVAFRNTGKVLRAWREKRISTAEMISAMLYMYSLSAYVVTLAQMVLSLILFLMNPVASSGSFISTLVGIVLFLYSYFFLFYYADAVDNDIPFRWSSLPLMLVSFVTSMVVGAVSQIVGLVRYRHQDTWVKTEHKLHAQQEEGTLNA